MKITVLSIGKTEAGWLVEGEKEYLKRLPHYCNFEWKVLPAIKKLKSLSREQVKEEEGKLLLDNLATGDWVVLLDEKGKELDSPQLAGFLQQKMNAATRHLVFIIGGAYGFSQPLYQRANQKLALSKLTFSHQMVRVFLLEQLYRGFSILRGEKYHH